MGIPSQYNFKLMGSSTYIELIIQFCYMVTAGNVCGDKDLTDISCTLDLVILTVYIPRWMEMSLVQNVVSIRSNEA
jgi:hypothetical protein